MITIDNSTLILQFADFNKLENLLYNKEGIFTYLISLSNWWIPYGLMPPHSVGIIKSQLLHVKDQNRQEPLAICILVVCPFNPTPPECWNLFLQSDVSNCITVTCDAIKENPFYSKSKLPESNCQCVMRFVTHTNICKLTFRWISWLFNEPWCSTASVAQKSSQRWYHCSSTTGPHQIIGKQ